MKHTILTLTALLLAPLATLHAAGVILHPDKLRTYVEQFNAADKELCRQYAPNKNAVEFLHANVPLFDCPDVDIERAYCFR